MSKIKKGNTVTIHYTGKLNDGTVFDSSISREPFKFTVGKSSILPVLEDAVVGMNAGDTKTVNIPMEDAFGPYKSELVLEIEQDKFPDDIELKVGQTVELKNPDTEPMLASIVDISPSTVKLDGNHPLVGKDLVFDIQVMAVDS